MWCSARPWLGAWPTSYRPGLRTLVVSNLAFLDVPEQPAGREARTLTTIGFLSNISLAKGIDRYLDLFAELRATGSRIAGRIAGPYIDLEVQRYVEKRIKEIGGIDYVGAVDQDQKALFFSSIDLLVFPTRYRHEAQPLVIYEAQAAGVPVAASDRGCIGDMIAPAGPLLLDFAGSEIASLVNQIIDWEKDPLSYSAELQRTRDRFALQTKQRAVAGHRFWMLVPPLPLVVGVRLIHLPGRLSGASIGRGLGADARDLTMVTEFLLTRLNIATAKGYGRAVGGRCVI